MLQAEQSDCGLTALAMIAHHFGHNLNLTRFRHQFAAGGDTTSLKSLLLIADGIGLAARPVRLGVDEIRQLKLPAILHWDLKHFVVAIKVRRRGVVIHDPAAGRRLITAKALSDAFSGVAIEFSRASHFQKQKPGRAPGLREFARSLEGLRGYLGLMLVLLLATQVLALAPPVATQLLIDEVVLGRDRQWLFRILFGIALIMVAMLVLDTLRRWVVVYTSTRLAADTTAAVVSHLFHLPLASVDKRPIGDLISRIESLKPIRTAITETLLSGVVNAVIIVTTMTVMTVYSVRLTLISVGALLLLLIVHAVLLPASRAANLEAVIASAQSSQSLIESLRSFHAMRALGLRSQRLAHWQKFFAAAINAGARQARLGIITGAGQSLITSTEQLLFLAIGISGVVSKQLTLGVLFAFLSLRGRLSLAALQLLSVVRDIYLLRSHINRVGEIVQEEIEPVARSSACRKQVTGEIACSDLSFRYPGGAHVLRRFSCVIRAGESVVIAGPSGAGKTTLLNLLAGGLRADAGLLLFDGLELPLWDSDALQRQFGVVLQSDHLFQGSISDNISCFEAMPDIARIRDAAQLALIWKDIQALPMHVHTPVAGASGGLSGGQVQRILLARALYRSPRILFLDEATSHLDVDTETQVLTNLNLLGITIVSVAHGENAMRFCDRQLSLAVNHS